MSYSQSPWSGGLGPHPQEGDPLGRYRLGTLIGTGGMASVYRGVDEDGSPLAIKVLNPARVVEEDVKRFTREYKALARMDHENIVRVYEAGVHRGYPWIAMELVEGHDLDSEIAGWKVADPPDRWARVDRILRGLCRGLGYVHDLGLVHRDLKPSNVLLTPGGEPKISDFGVVKSGDNTQTTQLTMAGRLVGTVAFMAPELITDEGLDKRTDLYALGAVLYLMCTLRRPIEADSVAGYLARHLSEVPKPIGDLAPDAPAVYGRLCARLLQKDRAYRYPSAQAVLQALDRPEGADGPPLRGRDEVMARASAGLTDLLRGKGRVLGLVGPTGAGRSRVLEAVVELAKAQGLRVGHGRGAGDPFGELAMSLEISLSGVLDGEAFASSLGTEPAVIAVDDLDRAEPAVIAALARILRDGRRRLLLVFTARDTDGDLSALTHRSETMPPYSEIRLGAVDPTAVTAMLRDRGVTGPVTSILCRRLHADYAGLPGPMIHQVQALVDAGWLVRAGDLLRPARPLDEYRKADLPVPAAVAARLTRDFEALDPSSLELCELLAILDRPASPTVLERCRPDDRDTGRLLDALVQQRILARSEEEAQEQVALADPCAPRWVRQRLEPARSQQLHAAVAVALSAHRRRTNALEVARHLRAAGREALAYPFYVQAARRSAREGRFGEVLEICEAAEAVRAAGEPLLEAEERPRNLRWLYLLRGEALLARRSWNEAIPPLEAAVAAAREEGDPATIARTVGSLGRACYRAGRFAPAEPLLREALALAPADATERSSALRALADITLRGGRLDEADQLWAEAVVAAQELGSPDALARARRGVAHVRAIQGDLPAAMELLSQADDLLNPDGDYRVRAGVLARAIELDTTSGRYGTAAYRAESLIDLARRHGMGERLPEAYALLAELQLRIGKRAEAEASAQQALVFAKAAEDTEWDARLRAARVLAEVGRVADALSALPAAENLAPSPVDDPSAQFAAVRARLLAGTEPTRARDLAVWALTRPAPLLSLAGTRIALDAAEALAAIGQGDAARNALKRGLKLLGAHGDGTRLELLVVLARLGPDPRVDEAIRLVAQSLGPSLPTAALEAFQARPELRRVLGARAASAKDER